MSDLLKWFGAQKPRERCSAGRNPSNAKEEPLMKSPTRQFPSKNPQRNQGIVVAFVLAALIVLFIVLYAANRGDAPQYGLTIKELGGDSMLAYSNSEELGYGEILLDYGANMVVEDVNGQVIDRGELHAEDRIRVTIAPRDEGLENDHVSDPVLEKIILLPDGSDEYV